MNHSYCAHTVANFGDEHSELSQVYLTHFQGQNRLPQNVNDIPKPSEAGGHLPG